MKKSILPIVLFFVLVSCKKDDSSLNEGDDLVTKITYTGGSLIPEITEVSSESTIAYTPNGWRSKETILHYETYMGGEPRLTYTENYEHTYVNGLPSQTVGDSYFIHEFKTTYAYNNAGQLIQKTTVQKGNQSHPTTDEYAYSGKRLQTHIHIIRDEGRGHCKVNSYTYNGNEVYLTETDYDLVNQLKSNERQSVYTYTMNNEGAVASKSEKNYSSETIVIDYYQYDQKRNPLYRDFLYRTVSPESFLDPKYAPHNLTKHSYTYKGGLVHILYEYEYNGRGFPKSYKKRNENRVIEYKEFEY